MPAQTSNKTAAAQAGSRRKGRKRQPRGDEAAGLVLLATKLHVPALGSDLVPRPRLLELLADEAVPRLTLVSAPPGWGKTTLLAAWTEGQPDRRFAWVSLDDGDNDPVRFWTYIVEALQAIEPAVGGAALSVLGGPRTSIVDGVLPALLNELEGLPRQVLLVLDDYHVIGNGEVHEQLAYLLEHLPASLRLVLATRADPPLPLARLRARQEMIEIRAEELRFSLTEAAALLNDLLRLALDDAAVARLEQRTEGWAAGLYLAALSLRGRADPDEFIQAFAGDDRHIVDYLGVEVLDSQPAQVRTFLLRTSILGTLSASLCDAVTGIGGSAGMLAEIERSNVFLIPLDSRRRWYRYHHLFGELLRHELAQAEPDLAPTLHRRAAAWYRENGFVSEAVMHAVAAGDVAEAGELIARHWSGYSNQGRLATVASWLDALPPEAVAADPRLCLVRAWTSLNGGRLDEVDGWIERAEREPRADEMGDGDGGDSLRSGTAIVRAVHRYMIGDVGEACSAARRAIELERGQTFFWRTVARALLGMTLYWRGESSEAVSALEETLRLAQKERNSVAVVHALGFLAAVHADRGDLRGSERLLECAAKLLTDEPGLAEHYAPAMAETTRGEMHERRGELTDAEAALSRGVELARRGGRQVQIAHCLLALAQSRHGRGEGSRELLHEARRIVDACPDPGILAARLATAERRLRVAPVGGGSSAATSADELSDRELAVLRLLPTELSQREIGAALFVSYNTVKTHVKSIFRKLRASTRAEAVARAREHGLI